MRLVAALDHQPRLHAQLKALPWRQLPVVDATRDKAHGRVESRTVKITEVAPGIGCPHVRLAIQITRRRHPFSGRWRSETVYATSDLDRSQIHPEGIADILRGHWFIENRLHWIRDVIFGEDHSRIRTGHASGASVLP